MVQDCTMPILNHRTGQELDFSLLYMTFGIPSNRPNAQKGDTHSVMRHSQNLCQGPSGKFSNHSLDLTPPPDFLGL